MLAKRFVVLCAALSAAGFGCQYRRDYPRSNYTYQRDSGINGQQAVPTAEELLLPEQPLPELRPVPEKYRMAPGLPESTPTLPQE